MVQIIPRQPSFGERVGVGLGAGFSKGFTDSLQGQRQEKSQMALLRERANLDREAQAEKLRGEYEADKENYSLVENEFGKDFAQIWKAAPTGARTELIKVALEARARGIDLSEIVGGKSKKRFPSNEQSSLDEFTENDTNIDSEFSPQENEKDVFNELDQILGDQNENLLPEEKFKRGTERYSTGLKVYQEAGEKLRGLTRDKERIDILSNLEKSKKLPKGLGRINVDSEGNLRLPFASSKESQRFIKTLNEFSSGAKDTFGARVTNFDLAQYLKRFPTLLNTAEGRKQLYEQMGIVNQINSVYYKNLKNVYDRAGGVRNIDADVAERLAENMTEPQVNKLSQKFSQIGEFSSKPSPEEFKGKKIRDKKTGEIFVSDGKDWVLSE